jgi:hypothetical protein
VRKNRTAAKVRQANGGAKVPQGKVNGNGKAERQVVKAEKAKSEKVQIGKKFLKKWDLAAAPSGKSPQFKRFKTNAHLKQFIEDQLSSGVMLKGIAAELKVTPARVWEMAHQLSIDIKGQKAQAPKKEA